MIKVTPYTLLGLDNLAFTDWYVIFQNSDRWWAKFLKDGFSHVYAIRWLGDSWVKFEMMAGYTDIQVFPCYDRNIRSIVEEDCSAILHVKNWREMQRYSPIVGPMSCVEQIKTLLGIHSFSITPWQLYKELCND